MRRSVVVLASLACSRAPTNDCPPLPISETASLDASMTTPSWTPVPATLALVDELLARSRRRPIAVAPDRTPYGLERASHDLAHAHAGEDDIAGALGGGGVLLFGATHDSAAQVDAFRSIVTRIKGLEAIALEQLTTDADADLEAFFRSGDDASRNRLRDRHRSHDYAAWKFGYTSKIEDVVVAARGVGVRTLGCDLPPDKLPAGLIDDSRSSLRELHCAEAIRQATSVALLVGANHAETGGLRTFVPPEVGVRSVFFVGGRDPGFADGEAGRLVAIEPVMFDLDAAASVLLLAEPSRLLINRVRDPHVPSSVPTATLFVSSDVSVTFEVAGARVLVGPKGEWFGLRSTRYVFAFQTEGPVVVGGVQIPLGGWTELHLGEHSLDITEHGP